MTLRIASDDIEEVRRALCSAYGEVIRELGQYLRSRVQSGGDSALPAEMEAGGHASPARRPGGTAAGPRNGSPTRPRDPGASSRVTTPGRLEDLVRTGAQGPAYLFAQRFLWECLTSRTIDQLPITAASHEGKRRRPNVRRDTATAAVQHMTRECSDHRGQFAQEHGNDANALALM